MATSNPSQLFATLDVEKGASQIVHEDITASYRPAPPPSPPPRVANPSALGLFSFASTTVVLSLYNLQMRGVHTQNVVLGMAIFTGGLSQFIAGMWDFPRGDMFGGTAFASYGAFWMSYATILIPGTGVLEAYKDPNELRNALGIYLMGWSFVTFLFLVVALRKSLAFIIVFALLGTVYLILAVGEFSGSTAVTKTGGAIGLFTAMGAYYVGLSELLAAEDYPVMRLPLGVFKGE